MTRNTELLSIENVKVGDRVRVTEGGENIPTGTVGTVTEVDLEHGLRNLKTGEMVPAARVNFPGCKHVWHNGARGVWVDLPSLAPEVAQ